MFKRIFDIIIALFCIAIFSPMLVIIAILLKLEDGGPIFYRGQRVGLYGNLFRIFKFRTMVVNAEKLGGPSTAGGDPRITKTGAFLRKYKLDELPQLFNIINGDMSFVGPRPEVKIYTDMYTDNEKVLLQLRPGITDYASIWNNDEAAILAGHADPEKAYLELVRPEKIRLQLKYYREKSLLTDLKIIFQTVRMIFATRT